MTAEEKKYTAMARTIAHEYLNKRGSKIQYKPGGHTNFVFEAKAGKESFIIRIGKDRHKIDDFIKEESIIKKAGEFNIPVAAVLEVGSSIVDKPYMIQRKVNGEESKYHRERSGIIKQMGALTAHIHTIATYGYGGKFSFEKNQPSLFASWKKYFDDELKVEQRLSILEKYEMITLKDMRKLKSVIALLRQDNKKPVLHHGDIRMKNIIVDKSGKIVAVLDWENAVSQPRPFWDLSIALHDLNIDEKQIFLNGYGMNLKTFMKMSSFYKVFNLLNYARVTENAVKKHDKKSLLEYKLRLGKHLDLFCM